MVFNLVQRNKTGLFKFRSNSRFFFFKLIENSIGQTQETEGEKEKKKVTGFIYYTFRFPSRADSFCL